MFDSTPSVKWTFLS